MSDIKQYEPLWGSWYVDSLIGEGSYGKVYKVHKEEFGKTYFSAVKIISIPQSEAEVRQARDDGLDEASIRSYFHAQVTDILQEIDLMSTLRGNSNIVSFEDHKVIERPGEIAWDILIRMELLTSLRDHILEKPTTPGEVAKLGIDICKALELCAQRQIIHRDIKPENIFISEFGEYKLGDFGIARQIEKTSSGLSKKGTYTYMAPEVFKGEEYGASVDTYSLGLVMYRLLNVNRTPFLPDYPAMITPKDREMALQRRMRGEAIPPPRNGSEALKEAVLRACAFDRGERFVSAGEMREALKAAVGRRNGSAPASQPLDMPEMVSGVEDITSAAATMGVFTSRPDVPPKEEMDGEGKPTGEKPKDRKRSGRGKKLILPIALAVCILAGLVLAMVNLQVRSIELPEGGTLHKGDAFEQAYALSPPRPLISDLTWSSSDERVLTVSESGEVTAVGPGSATITLVSARGKTSGTITYDVEQRAEAIEGLPEGVRLTIGETAWLKPWVTPLDTTDTLTYESSAMNVATVDGQGEVRALDAGETTIRIQSGDVTRELPVTVYVAAEEITGLPSEMKVIAGETLRLNPVVLPSTSEEAVEFGSEDEQIATVDQVGNVTGWRVGHTVVWVECGGVREEVAVEVWVPVEKIKGLPDAITLMKGESHQLVPEVVPKEALEPVRYKSSNNGVATVYENGTIYAIGAGSANVVVTCGEAAESVSVTVVIPAEAIGGLNDKYSIAVGDSLTLSPTIYPEGATDTTVYFESSDPSVVSVSEDGVITGRKEGIVALKVSCGRAVRNATVETFLIDVITIKGRSYPTTLTKLYLYDMNLTNADIESLKYMTNLTKLSLWDNQISDISALSGLMNLTDLSLRDNQISDISALSGLTNLTELDLSFNQISNISALSGLTNLTDLDLMVNQISDLSTLSGLTNLVDLGLGFNQISDISALSGLMNLTDLSLRDNQITDWSPVMHIKNVRGRP